MKEPGNNKDDEMKDFLRRAAEGRLEDDFEREAAEGFKTMSHEEILAAKASADRKARRLFGESPAIRASWSVAAGVALVIGLTVYFLRDDVFPDKDLALDRPVTEAELRPGPPRTAPSPLTMPDSAGNTGAGPRQTTAQSPREAGKKPSAKEARSREPGQDPATMSADQESMVNAAPMAESKSAEPSGDDQQEAVPQGKVAPDLTLAGSGAAGNAAPAREDAPVIREKETSRQKKLKRAEAMPQPAAREGMEESAYAYIAVDSVTVFIVRHLKKNLPANLSRPFAAVLNVDDKGKLGDALLLEGQFSEAEKKALTSFLNGTEVREIREKGLVTGSRKLTLVYAP